jgi:uncharacterized protein (TIGR03083 family)
MSAVGDCIAGMDVAEHIEQLAEHGPSLAEAAARAGWDTPVPGTSWKVRNLVTHVGGIHRWAADIVRTGATGFATEAGRAVGTGPDDGELIEWFLTGHAELVDTLRRAPDDLSCATFLPADSPRAFWARRQAHETAVHRADAAAAAGERTRFAATFAQDGIAEMLHGFARRKSNAVDFETTISLSASDGPSWLIKLGGERIDADHSDSPGRATLAGTSSDLYLWLWNRPSDAELTGDPESAALWRNVRVRWG